ncbi:unnamed protein product [Amoebophrya sp. A25]|nr:unnamed protein product [Amoebophrya sp. A25]|eukprot:GSA25T00012984001.1
MGHSYSSQRWSFFDYLSSAGSCCQAEFAGARALGVPLDPLKWDTGDLHRAARALFYRHDTDDLGKLSVEDLYELFYECSCDLADFRHLPGQDEVRSLVQKALEEKRTSLGLGLLQGNAAKKCITFDEFFVIFEFVFSHLRDQGLKKHFAIEALGEAVAEELVGERHCLIVSLDYRYNKPLELTATHDGLKIERLARNAGISDVVTMFDTDVDLGDKRFPHVRNVRREIKQMGGRCVSGDVFIFFYSGHGLNVPDKDGDEADGEDEAFATPDREGDLTEDDVFIDDDFARLLERSIPAGVKILVITDCCHSGSICDIDSFAHSHEIIAVAAAQDDQTSIDMASLGGQGGILTNALAEAVFELQHERHVSVADVYNLSIGKTAAIAQKLHHVQAMNIQCANCHAGEFPWPLRKSYLSRQASVDAVRRAGALSVGNGARPGDGMRGGWTGAMGA